MNTIAMEGRRLVIILLLSIFPMSSLGDCDTLGGWYGNDDIGACYGLDALTNTAAPQLNMNWFEAVSYCKSVLPGKSFLGNIKSQVLKEKCMVLMNMGSSHLCTGCSRACPVSFAWCWTPICLDLWQ